MKMENSNLHLKIREERIKQGLSQKELGEMVGLPQQAINRIEQGQRKLDVELFEKLCQVLKIKKIGSFSVNFISSYYQTEPIDISEYEQNQREEAARNAPKFMGSDNSIYTDPNMQKLYEVAIEKAVRHEKLTEEEEQVIIGIPGQLRQKSDSYEDSYSFASSEEELNKILKQHQKQREELLLNDYRKLNEIGQLEARKRVSELTEIPRYTKPDEPPQD